MPEPSDKNTEENPTRGHPSISTDELIKLQDAAEAGDLQAQTRLAEIEGLASYEEYKRLHQQVFVKFEMDTDPKSATILKSISDAAVSKPLIDQMREMLVDANSPLSKVGAELSEEIRKTFKPEMVTKPKEIIGFEPADEEKWIDELSKIGWRQFPTRGPIDMTARGQDNDGVYASSLLVPYNPSAQEQLIDEMAENNRLNREILEELQKQNMNSDRPRGFQPRFPDEEYLIRTQASLEYWPAPFDTLDSTLSHVLETAQLSMLELSYRRESAALAKAIYYIEWKLNRAKSVRLGSIDLRKLDSNVTAVRIESLVTGQSVEPFVEVVRNLRGYSEDAKNISTLVLDSSKLADSQAAIAKRASGKLRRKKNKIPAMPTSKTAAYRWVLVWEKIEPKINEDPTLRIDHDELIQYLKANGLSIKDDTLRKIVTRGRAGKIPSRTEFERENKM